jgi:gliding motility-associated-like protein
MRTILLEHYRQLPNLNISADSTLTFDQQHIMPKGLTLTLALLYLTTWGILPTYSQVQVVEGISADQWVRTRWSSKGIHISRITPIGPNNQTAVLTANSGDLGFREGLLLSTGRTTRTIGPNAFPAEDLSTTTATTPQTDPALQTLLPNGLLYDRSGFEIEFIPAGDSISFEFLFASEEYPTPDAERGHDLIAAFLNGIGANNLNMFRVEGQPVQSRTINGTAQPESYIDNTTASNPGFSRWRWNGYTRVFRVSAPVFPCQTYTLRIVAADGLHPLFDSGILLLANSLQSTAGLTLAARGVRTIPFQEPVVDEGCNETPATFTLTRTNTQRSENYAIIVEGTATDGTDYRLSSRSFSFLAGQANSSISIETIADTETEPELETIVLAVVNTECGETVRKTLFIRDIAPLTVQLTAPNAACFNNTITVSAIVTGGTGNRLFQWAHLPGLNFTPNTNIVITRDTTIRVEVLDFCAAIAPATASIFIRAQRALPGRPPLELRTSNDTSICPAGQATLTAQLTGGQPPYQYRWESTTFADAAERTVSPSAFTEYTLYAADQCEVLQQVIRVDVFARPQLNILPVDQWVCHGQSVPLTATGTGGRGNYTYQWRGAGTAEPTLNARPLAPTTYAVTMNDGCLAQPLADSVRLLTRTPLQLTGEDERAACIGTTITLSVTPSGGVPPYTITWDNGRAFGETYTVSPSALTRYQAVLTDACGSEPETLIVTVGALATTGDTLAVAINPSDTVLTRCQGEQVNLSAVATGGTLRYEYSWSVNGTPFPSRPDLSFRADTGQIIELVVDDVCTIKRQRIRVQVFESLRASAFLADTTICPNDSLSLRVQLQGGAPNPNFVWSTGASGVDNILVIPSGRTTYIVSVSDRCTTRPINVQFNVGVHSLPQLTGPSVISDCVLEQIPVTVRPSGGLAPYRFQWSDDLGTNDSALLPNDTTKSYTVTVRDACDSEATQTVTVQQFPRFRASFVASSDTICTNQPVRFTFDGEATDAVNFRWDLADGLTLIRGSILGRDPIEANAIAAGVYPVTLTLTLANCPPQEFTRNIIVALPPTLSFIVPAPQCLKDNQYTFANNSQSSVPVRYSWNFGSNVTPNTSLETSPTGIRFQTAGAFDVLLEARAGACTTTLVQSVTVWPAAPTPNIPVTLLCPKNATLIQILDTNPLHTYRWYDTINAETPIATGTRFQTPVLDSSRNYWVEAVDERGCTSIERAQASVSISDIANLDFEANDTVVEIPLAIVTLQPKMKTRGAYFFWTFGDGGQSSEEQPTYNYQSGGNFSVTLTVKDNAGCVQSVVKPNYIEVIEDITQFLPTAFSPNGDFMNDFWRLGHRMIREMELIVFSRSGAPIYITTDKDFIWDGTHYKTGVPILEGVYTYRITGFDYRNRSINKVGYVTIIR